MSLVPRTPCGGMCLFSERPTGVGIKGAGQVFVFLGGMASFMNQLRLFNTKTWTNPFYTDPIWPLLIVSFIQDSTQLEVSMSGTVSVWTTDWELGDMLNCNSSHRDSNDMATVIVIHLGNSSLCLYCVFSSCSCVMLLSAPCRVVLLFSYVFCVCLVCDRDVAGARDALRRHV